MQRDDILHSLKTFGESQGASLTIGTAALYLSLLDHQTAQAGPYLDHLERLARDVTTCAGRMSPADSLATAICEMNGYSGDVMTYEDMQNADFVRVIDRRRGLPVALSILFVDAARRAGLSAHGIAFPGHFLVRLDQEEGVIVIDPFANGAQLDEGGIRRLLQRTAGHDEEVIDRHLQSARDVEVLLRLLNNIKIRAVAVRKLDRAADIVERMTLIAPQNHDLWMERGIINAERGSLGDALRHFDLARKLAPSDAARVQVQRTRDTYRRRLN